MTLLYLAVAFSVGIVLGQMAWNAGALSCDFPAWPWIALIGALPFTPLLNHLQPEPNVALRWPRSAGFRAPRPSLTLGLLAALVLCLAAGFARYAAHPLFPCLTPEHLAYWNAPNELDDATPRVDSEGYIVSYPSVRDTTQRLDVRIQNLTLDGKTYAVEGVARLEADITHRFVYGQPVSVTGYLTDPYTGDGGSYREYLARRSIYSQLQRPTVAIQPGDLQGNPLLRVLYRIRARGEDAVNRLLPMPYASIANGMLLGIETGIPRELMERFHATGTSHVIVISGSNVALIAGVLAGLFARLLGKRRAWVPVVIGIAAYALLVGGDKAVLRAALMGGLAVVAVGLGRRGTGLITLAAACWMLALTNPLTLWDVGFQLSAMATAGLILFTPMLAGAAAQLWPGWMGGALTSPYSSGRTTAPQPSSGIVRGLFEDSVVVSLAATIAVTPLIAYTFGRVSVTGMLANLLIVPVQPLITMWGSAGALSGALGATMPAQLLLWLAWPGLFWTVEVVERVASLPFASIEIANYGLTAMLATYVALGTLLWRKPISSFVVSLIGTNRLEIGGALQQPVLLIAVGLVTLLVWWAYLVQPDGRLHLYFLDIGQGDAIFIQTPSGRQVLIDGGSSPQALSDELGAVMPFWDRSLDMVILTHADSDHMEAQTQVMERFDVNRAISTRHTLKSTESAAWRMALARKDVSVDTQHAGGWIDLGDGVALWTLSPAAEEYIGPDPDNATSLVLKLVYGDFSALLTADAGLVSEADWLANEVPVDATVLKAGHHGSRTSTGAPFVAAVDPQVAVIQVGTDNRYGHPHAEVLNNLAGRLVLRNDVDGRIHIVCDGREVTYETETNPSVGRISLRQRTPPP